MRVVFRADASARIGTRRLTPADALAASGSACAVVGRIKTRSLEAIVRGEGHVFHPLPAGPPVRKATATAQRLARRQPDGGCAVDEAAAGGVLRRLADRR